MDPWIDNKLDIFFDKNSPEHLNMEIFKEIFAKLNEYEHTNPELYQYELWRIRDLKNSFDYALEEGRIKRQNIAKQLLELNQSVDDIMCLTKLTREEVLQMQ